MTVYVSKEQQAFKIGDRICLSQLGRDRFKKNPDRAGTVTGYSHTAGAVQILFDGRKTSTIIHTTYLQRLSQFKLGELQN